MAEPESEPKQPGPRVHPVNHVAHRGTLSGAHPGHLPWVPCCSPTPSPTTPTSPGDLLLMEQWPTLRPGARGLAASPSCVESSSSGPHPGVCIIPDPQRGACFQASVVPSTPCRPLPGHPPPHTPGQNSLHRDRELPWGALALPDQEGSRVVPLHQNFFCQLPGNPARVPPAERGQVRAGEARLPCPYARHPTPPGPHRSPETQEIRRHPLYPERPRSCAQGHAPKVMRCERQELGPVPAFWLLSLSISHHTSQIHTSVNPNPANPSWAFPFQILESKKIF